MTVTADYNRDQAPDRILVDASFILKSRLERIAGCRWNAAARKFSFPATWNTCLALRTEFGTDLLLTDDLLEWAWELAETRQYVLETRNDFARDVPLPDLPGMDRLFAHQRTAADLIARSARFLILDETGTGKTSSALAGISLLQHRGDVVTPLLIVCPKSVLRNWSMEMRFFFPDADVREVTGTPAKVKKLLEPGAFAYVISYDLLRRYSKISAYPGAAKLTDTQRAPGLIQELGIKALIVDEIHRAKSPQAQSTRAVWQVADEANVVVGLTGTPIQDTPDDLWSILRIVDPQGFSSRTAYRERFLEIEWNNWGGKDVTGLKPHTSQEFFALFHSMSRLADKQTVLPFLPPKIHEIRWVEMPPKLRTPYRQMEKHLFADLGESGSLAAANPMVAAGRLIQMCNSAGEIVIDETQEDPLLREKYRMTLPSPKIDALLSDIAAGDFDGQSCVVFSASRQLLGLLETEFARKGIEYVMIAGDVSAEDRNLAIERFQAKEVPWMLLSPAGDTGITLTAASTMIRLVRSWSYIAHTQTEDRVHRIGSEQHDSVTYIDYLVQDTVEEGQYVRLNDKHTRASEVLRPDELRDLLGGSK